ncbi:MAG: helicase-exonuclease AddAB subunit AddA [Oscillospiraceae bacterium]|nr:helicase-exonuclease AddAB subunit AddA [Oscillospiraceae bacterium]
MARIWTTDQQTAITARGGTLLLSAAAGSGKTAVLVERVLQRLIDTQTPCAPENLLVVTFTNAAAAEMKQKITAAVSALAREHPGRHDLARLSLHMQNAQISTMDTFCIRLIRENFSAIGVTPDFRICEGGEANLMRSAAMNKTIHALHEREDGALLPLLEQFFKGSDDALLAECIEKLYDNSCSYPFPALWLDGVAGMYSTDLPIFKTLWGQAILKNINGMLRYCAAIADKAAETLEGVRETEAALYASLRDPIDLLRQNIARCKNLIAQSDWDALASFAASMPFARLGSAKKTPLKEALSAKYNTVKAELQKELPRLLCATEGEHAEDMALLRPVAEGLVFAAKLFRQYFEELKAEANVLDFSDTLHHALNLLYTLENGEPRRTPFALELAEQFEEILIDEYQDTNEAQDMLFRGISKNERNLFMVGDVKQSIYGFRLANPGIFVAQSDRLPLYETENYPAKVILGKNFRSRAGVIGAVNFFFTQIMSRRAGAVQYDAAEMLYCGREDTIENVTDPDMADAEIHFLDYNAQESEERASTAEARPMAALIGGMVRNKIPIEGKDGNRRPVRYGDFCVLLRAASGKSAVYTSVLRQYGIPVQGANSRSFFESREIATFLSLLKVIDNPLCEVELLSALLSPVYGFTPDEIACLRIENRAANLYDLLSLAAQSGDAKTARVLADLQKYRSLCTAGGAAGFIRELLAETKFTAILSAMQDSDERKANIALLLSYAEGYDSWGTPGLSGFLRYLERLRRSEGEQNGKKSGCALLPAGGADNVAIMTIHNSKGLEFPIVILADTFKGFNLQDTSKELLIHTKLGIGMQIRKPEEFKKYPSVAYCAIKNQIIEDLKSEEMRVLYVALTRAREKLIVLATADNMQKKISDTASRLTFEQGRISPDLILSQSSYAAWLLAACLRHPTAGGVLRGELETTSALPPEFVLESAPPLKVLLSPPQSPEEMQPGEMLCTQPAPEEDEEREAREQAMLALLHERMDYAYPYASLGRVASKYAASALSHTAQSTEFIGLSKPAFLKGEPLSGADAGTAAHKFLQFCDFSRAKTDFEAEKERLLLQNRLSAEQAAALRPEKILAFLESPLCARILNAQSVYREKRFAITVRAGEIDPTLPPETADEPVLIQGVTDLVFVENGRCVIVDYKTDRVNDKEDLTERYAAQLRIYKQAVERVFGLPVCETVLYSLHLNKAMPF